MKTNRLILIVFILGMTLSCENIPVEPRGEPEGVEFTTEGECDGVDCSQEPCNDVCCGTPPPGVCNNN